MDDWGFETASVQELNGLEFMSWIKEKTGLLLKSYIKLRASFKKRKYQDLKWKGNVHKLNYEVLSTGYSEDQIVKDSLKAKDVKQY